MPPVSRGPVTVQSRTGHAFGQLGAMVFWLVVGVGGSPFGRNPTTGCFCSPRWSLTENVSRVFVAQLVEDAFVGEANEPEDLCRHQPTP